MKEKQKYTSKKTSVRKVAKLFSNVYFEPQTRILDWGGGKYDDSKEFMRNLNVNIDIYDPYNRNDEHNLGVLKKYQETPADVITINNVLNVIVEKEVRKELLLYAKTFLKPDGYIYISVYEGDKTGKIKLTGSDQVQLNRKVKDYIEEIKNVFRYVKYSKGYLVAGDIPVPDIILRKDQCEAVMQKHKTPLYTLKGSKITRSPAGVGKLIGGQIYAHRNYLEDIVPDEILKRALELKHKEYLDFNFNCFMYDKKKNILRFDEAQDFDIAREPHPGNMLKIDLTTEKVTVGESWAIWHHKWLWVKDDYKGFNVAESYEWSRNWLSKLKEPASGSEKVWEKQLIKYNVVNQQSGIYETESLEKRIDDAREKNKTVVYIAKDKRQEQIAK